MAPLRLQLTSTGQFLAGEAPTPSQAWDPGRTGGVTKLSTVSRDYDTWNKQLVTGNIRYKWQRTHLSGILVLAGYKHMATHITVDKKKMDRQDTCAVQRPYIQALSLVNR